LHAANWTPILVGGNGALVTDALKFLIFPAELSLDLEFFPLRQSAGARAVGSLVGEEISISKASNNFVSVGDVNGHPLLTGLAHLDPLIPFRHGVG